jgi:hypothetical protein
VARALKRLKSIIRVLKRLSVYQLNGVNRHQVSRLKRDTVLVNFVGFGNRFLFYLEEECSSVICM